ncbi:hypothetical protein [Mucilaginibacter myungsuensis]|uniref:Uncharacterized protein n=1 Tax=Mucilaginibacter myungsuensis TaxID=649104 RepID=A0A929KZL0_9SPHI|nr:hypothetical protein [Mucilaginibacter myungsuensis]MBE9661784.1 hypothetical protein [Mucilaginibacter myungsuensis]MDN3599782.1 hypothetical protein [Mucilaginibacter myungsuensis]
MKVDLNYPIVLFRKNDNMIYVFFNDKDFKSTNEELLKKIDHKDLEVIDSSGLKYKIDRAYKVKYLGLWGFSLLLKGRQILIDYDFNTIVEQLSLENFKAEIIKRLEKKKGFWSSAWSLKELKQVIANCSSFAEIMSLLK